MILKKLPHGIIYMRRGRSETRLIAILLAIFIIWLCSRIQIISPIKFLGKDQASPIMAILTAFYVGIAFSRTENIRNWLYEKLAHITTNDYIEVLEGKFTSKHPKPQILPVWITIYAKLGPVILVSIVPAFLFGLLGLETMQFGSFIIFLLNLSESVSSLYYAPFWNRSMIEYVREGSAFGIKQFDIYFFHSENSEVSIQYINSIQIQNTASKTI